MVVSGFTRSADTSQADWIARRLSPFGADRADSVIPAGFAAYARLLHPVSRADAQGERTVRWSEVAAWSGIGLERQSQFHDIALPRRAPARPAPWDGHGPAEGTLSADDARALVGILAGHTADEQRCWYCVWDGYGLDPAAAFAGRTDPTVLPDPVPGDVSSGPRVRLPARDYLLYAGPLAAARAVVDAPSPNLWWPEDRAWCVASEIDLPWTYLGGPEDLVEKVLADPRLEALPARPDDPIQLRVRGWLADLVDETVTELAEHGTVEVTTARGRVRARLARPTRREAGRLHISTENTNGVSSDGGTALPPRSQDELLHELRRALTEAITGLVDR